MWRCRMLALFSRPRRRGARPAQCRARLNLECLEGRALPSAVLPTAPALNTAMTTSTVAPAILSFAAVESGSTNVWTFSGTVAASNPAGLVVKLGGLQSLQGKTCTINSDGTFAMTVALQPGESGTASAQFVD